MKNINLSFEFFPPKNTGQKRRFWHTLGQLETLNPTFVSMTWGALGSDNQPSLDVLRELDTESSLPVAAHLTCYGCTRANLVRRLVAFQNMGINHIVALRGDIPSEASKTMKKAASRGKLPVDSDLSSGPVETLHHAEELVRLIRQSSGMDISVAAYPEAHPESKSVDEDLRFLKRKLDAGASRAITQFFFNPDNFLKWRDQAAAMGIDKPLVPGILPIHDLERVQVFARRCGTYVPAKMAAKFEACGDSAAAKRSVATELCLSLCETLQREGVEDFHLYTLNQSMLAYTVGRALKGDVRQTAVA